MGFFLKMRVSEICVKRICVNQGLGVPLTVEKNDAANGEVEKDSRPLRRIDHGQNNRHNKNQNFNK